MLLLFQMIQIFPHRDTLESNLKIPHIVAGPLNDGTLIP